MDLVWRVITISCILIVLAILEIDNKYIHVYTIIKNTTKFRIEVIIMDTNLSKWGNSAAIRIPKVILDKLNIDNNFENVSFSIDVDGNKLILEKKQDKTKFELLVEKSKGEKVNSKENIDWGSPVGKEEW